MKILLLQPPVQDFYDTDIRLQPLGLAYLKAALKKHIPEIQVVLRDYHHGWGRRTIPVPQELEYLKPFYKHSDESPFSTFYAYFHFGAPFDLIAEDAALLQPDLVGISSLFSPYYREVLKTAAAIKKKRPVPIIAGGSHVSALPEMMLKDPSIDFIIRGEGERPLVEFLKEWNGGRDFSKVPNLGFKKNGRLVLNEMEDNFPIEEIPVPDLSDFSPQDYCFERKPMTFLITSRSCPHRCSFCSVHLTFGTSYRRRSVESVLDEIRLRYAEGMRVFDFEDDNLTFYKDEMKALCRCLVSEFSGKDVRFTAMNGISYLSLDSELLGLMKAAGFTHLNLALVTSDLTVRETTKRPHTVEKYIEVVREASKLGFSIVSYQILGLPEETLESMIQTLVFNAAQPVLLGASMFYLTPNSPAARNFDPHSAEDIFKARLTAMAVETDHFKREDLFTLFICTRILNFLKGIRVDAQELTLEEALQLIKSAGARETAGVKILDRLLGEGRLYASTKLGLKPVERFKADLFFEIWYRISYLTTQNGKRISVNHQTASPSLSHAQSALAKG